MRRKNYIGWSLDWSQSMLHVAKAAARDYNQQIAAIKEAALAAELDTVVNVVKSGVGIMATVERYVVNSSLTAIQPIPEHEYSPNGHGTPMLDSIGELIELMEATPDANNPEVAFMVNVITDGLENASSPRKWKTKLVGKIRELQATDRWSFIFRVPLGGYKQELMAKYGIPEGNIEEWETTERGMKQSTETTKQAFTQYFADLKQGKTATRKFFTNLKDVDPNAIKAALVDISGEVHFWTVQTTAEGYGIRQFCESKLRQPMLKGAAFYQLTKKEKVVQDYKILAVREKSTGKIYTGPAARDLLSLPHSGNITIEPGDHGNWDIYIQSTSVNRKLPIGTSVLYWPNVGAIYKSRAA